MSEVSTSHIVSPWGGDYGSSSSGKGVGTTYISENSVLDPKIKNRRVETEYSPTNPHGHIPFC